MSKTNPPQDGLSEKDRAVLRIVQGNLPDSSAPFADIAAEVGVSEAEVVSLLAAMRQDGRIRRFGATLRHQRAGYGFNAMAAWKTAPEDARRLGEMMAARPEISHCYERLTYPEWPYNLYTMIHAKSRERCLAVVEELRELTGIAEYTVLFSIQELKKTSMAYF